MPSIRNWPPGRIEPVAQLQHSALPARLMEAEAGPGLSCGRLALSLPHAGVRAPTSKEVSRPARIVEVEAELVRAHPIPRPSGVLAIHQHPGFADRWPGPAGDVVEHGWSTNQHGSRDPLRPAAKRRFHRSCCAGSSARAGSAADEADRSALSATRARGIGPDSRGRGEPEVDVRAPAPTAIIRARLVERLLADSAGHAGSRTGRCRSIRPETTTGAPAHAVALLVMLTELEPCDRTRRTQVFS
jgi:hypothetical protein